MTRYSLDLRKVRFRKRNVWRPGWMMTDEPQDNKQGGWRIWPPSPKVQILLIVGVCGLINLCLLAIWVLAATGRLG